MDGVINVLKPPGMSSSNVVQDIRHLYQEKRAGHTGTLDPGAAGVLPVCIGRATKLFDYLVDKDKEYIAEITFGIATDTLDAYGAVLAQQDRIVSREELLAVLPDFLGTQMQTAPLYSALKVNGQKMYDLARKGVKIEPKQRSVTIDQLEIMNQTAPNRFLLHVVCSRGTYIRTLCEDIAERLHTVAYMSFLLRTRSGGFRVENACAIAELQADREHLERYVVSVEDTVSFLPAIMVNTRKERRNILNGCRVEYPQLQNETDVFRVYFEDEFLGIGKAEQGEVFLTFQANPVIPR